MILTINRNIPNFKNPKEGFGKHCGLDENFTLIQLASTSRQQIQIQ